MKSEKQYNLVAESNRQLVKALYEIANLEWDCGQEGCGLDEAIRIAEEAVKNAVVIVDVDA